MQQALTALACREVKHRMPRSIVFHSYKGGTGKTTIAANIGAFLARKGARVLLLDLDVYAPSLHSYFEIEPEKWLNDYLLDSAEVQDIMIDLTPVVAKESSDGGDKGGKLWVAFCNPGKEEVYKMEGGKQEKVQLLRKFISLREQLFSRYEADYLIIDTSPGIRYWSINALAVADVLYLTLKAGDLDIAGTKKMASDIYGALSKFGGKPYLILNRVAGYCVPHAPLSIKGMSSSRNGSDDGTMKVAHDDSALGHEYSDIVMQNQETPGELSKAVGIDVAIALPCFCDIQFSKKEFLTVLHDPQHPFAKMIADLAQKSQAPGGN